MRKKKTTAGDGGTPGGGGGGVTRFISYGLFIGPSLLFALYPYQGSICPCLTYVRSNMELISRDHSKTLYRVEFSLWSTFIIHGQPIQSNFFVIFDILLSWSFDPSSLSLVNITDYCTEITPLYVEIKTEFVNIRHYSKHVSSWNVVKCIAWFLLSLIFDVDVDIFFNIIKLI